MQHRVLFLIFFLTMSAGCRAGESVGQPVKASTSIQSRLDAATDGDTILVEPGTYFERINYWGKAVVVKSIAGSDSTIIDGERKGSVVCFSETADTFSVLDGFTIKNGKSKLLYSRPVGGGINAEYSSCKILNCDITENISGGETPAKGSGGGVGASRGVFVMRGCTILDNTAPSKGGGLYLGLISGYMSNNRIINNRSTGEYDNGQYYGGKAGGLHLSHCNNLLVENNIDFPVNTPHSESNHVICSFWQKSSYYLSDGARSRFRNTCSFLTCLLRPNKAIFAHYETITSAH